MKRDDRITIAGIGEYYDDYLSVDAFIVGKSKAGLASILLSEKIRERKTDVEERVKYLADKRGISFENMWKLILTNKAERITQEEYAEILEKLESED